MGRILIGNIKGPKGDTGAKGATGATGPTGPQGPLPPLIANYLASEAGKGALDAYMGKLIDERITANTNEIGKLNSDKMSGWGLMREVSLPFTPLQDGILYMRFQGGVGSSYCYITDGIDSALAVSNDTGGANTVMGPANKNKTYSLQAEGNVLHKTIYYLPFK